MGKRDYLWCVMISEGQSIENEDWWGERRGSGKHLLLSRKNRGKNMLWKYIAHPLQFLPYLTRFPSFQQSRRIVPLYLPGPYFHLHQLQLFIQILKRRPLPKCHLFISLHRYCLACCSSNSLSIYSLSTPDFQRYSLCPIHPFAPLANLKWTYFVSCSALKR